MDNERNANPADAMRDRRQRLITQIFEGTAGEQLESLCKSANNYADIESVRAIFTHAALQNERVWECTVQSIIQTLLLAVELDISVTGHNNGAYFEVRNIKIRARNVEPERWEARLGMGFGYNALIELATRDGRVVSIDTGCVREGDVFEYQQGTDPMVRHVIDYKANGAAPIAFYAIAHFANGGKPKVEIMSALEVAHIRATHAAEKSGAWNNNFGETGRKTPLRRLCKTLPTSPKFAAALNEFDASYVLPSAATEQQKTNPSSLSQRVMGAGADEPAPVDHAGELPAAGSTPSVDLAPPSAEPVRRNGKVEITQDDIPF